MAIKVYGSNICPSFDAFLSILTENGVMPQFINVTGSINLLKDFIYLRDTHPAFDAFRGTAASVSPRPARGTDPIRPIWMACWRALALLYAYNSANDCVRRTKTARQSFLLHFS